MNVSTFQLQASIYNFSLNLILMHEFLMFVSVRKLINVSTHSVIHEKRQGPGLSHSTQTQMM